ncbi:MAG: S8 family serine peptidase, partial [Deltaproteobacteria bacterium]|nr:S8 family serine peptidase [Deltaproteobacteria bacterium]
SAANGYAYRSGTSMAAPFVAGLAALLWSESPTLTASEVKHRILDNVDPLPALQGKISSGGRINAYGSLHPSQSSKDSSSPSASVSSGGGGGGCFVMTLAWGLSDMFQQNPGVGLAFRRGSY